MTHGTIEKRLWEKVQKTDGCWTFVGLNGQWRSTTGYGQIYWNRRLQPAHRVSYLLAGGVIPDGYELDHLCRNRACVRPDHLQPVTGQVNVLRGAGQAAIHALQTHCKRGHPFDAANTYYRKEHRSGRLWRRCRHCKNEGMRRARREGR